MIKCFEEFIKDEEVSIFLSFTKYLGNNAGIARHAMKLFDKIYGDFENDSTPEDADSPEFYKNLAIELQNEIENESYIFSDYYDELVDYFENAKDRNNFDDVEENMGRLINIYFNKKFGYPMVY